MYAPEWQWVIQLAYGLVSFGLAAGVYIISPTQRPNRLLALLLLVEGIAWLASGLIYGLVPAASPSGAGLIGANQVSFAAMGPVYLLFAGAALSTAQALRRPGVVRLLVVAAGAVPVLMLLAEHTVGYAALVSYPALFVAMLVGLWFAFQQWRKSAPGGLPRRRAKAYLLAFAVRDAAWLGLGGLDIWLATRTFSAAPAVILWLQLVWAVLGFVFLFALTYGLLRGQIFDLDHRIRLGISKSALAGVFVVVFFVVSEGTEALFSARFGQAYGIGAAAALVFAMRPLQRMADRLAARAAPSGKPLDAMDDPERIGMFREQVELAWEDQDLGEKEDSMLRRMAERLGIDAATAARVRAEVTGA